MMTMLKNLGESDAPEEVGAAVLASVEAELFDFNHKLNQPGITLPNVFQKH